LRRFARRGAWALSQTARALRRNRARKPGAELYQIKARGQAGLGARCARAALLPRHAAAAVRAAPALTRRAAQDAGAQKDGSVGAALVHVASGASFDLRLQALRNGAVRLRVSEPGKSRYSPPDVLLPEAEAAVVPFAIKQLDKKTLLLTPPVGDVTYRLTGSPFRLDVVRAARRVPPNAAARHRDSRANAARAARRRSLLRTASRCSA